MTFKFRCTDVTVTPYDQPSLLIKMVSIKERDLSENGLSHVEGTLSFICDASQKEYFKEGKEYHLDMTPVD